MYGVIVVVVLAFLFLGSGFSSGSSEVSAGEDTSFYVEDNGNLFIKLAKVTDQCCYFVVDIVVSGVSNVFDMILGG